jgi:hypothetical protein
MKDPKKLQYFVGKVCTIFTRQINRNYKEENPATFLEQMFHYFVGVVESVDEDGIMTTQVQGGQKSFWFMDNLVGIAEEQVLHPEKAEDAEIIQKYKAMKPETLPESMKKPASPFVDPAGLAQLAKQARS